MKKIARLIALAALIAIMAAGCQKEEATSVAPANSVTVRQVEYAVDGNRQHLDLKDNDAWRALLASSFDQVDAGHLVSLNHGLGTNPVKENVVYTTDIRDSALAWVDARFNEGYDVTMWYDTEENKYICVASKVAPPANVAPNGFVYQPLQQYILGSWEECLDREIGLHPNCGDVHFNADTGIYALTWPQIYDFYHIITPPYYTAHGTPRTLQFTTDSILISVYPKPYQILSPFKIGTPLNADNNYTQIIRIYEWSQDTMLVFSELSPMHIFPTIFTRTSN